MSFCATCESNPCTCRTAHAAASTNWLIRDCATPGCFTVVREPIGTQSPAPVCKWCQRGESHAKNGHTAVDIRLRNA